MFKVSIVRMGMFIGVLLLVIGCSNQTETNISEGSEIEHNHGSVDTVNPVAGSATEPVVEPVAVPEEEPLFALDATLQEEDGNYFLNIVTDLKLSTEHYGGAHVYGEGHVHFYLNDRLIGPIRSTDPYDITKYIVDKEAEYKIKLVLAGNNHSQPYHSKKELVIEPK